MNYIDDETPRHKKKSQVKPPKKATHKHIFEPCIIEYPKDWYKKPHEQNGEMTAEFSGYCPVCGKVRPTDQSRWWTTSQTYIRHFMCHQNVPTEEGARELNPETRTLRTFYHKDGFAKFVDID